MRQLFRGLVDDVVAFAHRSYAIAPKLKEDYPIRWWMLLRVIAAEACVVLTIRWLAGHTSSGFVDLAGSLAPIAALMVVGGLWVLWLSNTLWAAGYLVAIGVAVPVIGGHSPTTYITYIITCVVLQVCVCASINAHTDMSNRERLG